jgi:2-polyprenyl-3-methyl-5-hydroxy-6-metoxy-1,4-benzoquinol methylase
MDRETLKQIDGGGSASFREVSVQQVKEYWDRRPCNIRHSRKSLGSAEYFEEVEARKYFVEPHIRDFADFERWRGRKVLEIGCGIGTDMVNFARHGAFVTAVDLSAESLQVAQRRAKIYGLEDRIQFYNGSAEDLTSFLPAEPYDLIYSFGVIHHTPNPGRVIQQMRNYCAPGTIIKVMVYHRYSWKVFSILSRFGKGKFWRLSRVVAEHSEAQTGCPVTYIYSRNQGRELLESGGFHVVETAVEHIFPYRVSSYVNYQYEKTRVIRLLPQGVFRRLERQLGWHLLITAEAR